MEYPKIEILKLDPVTMEPSEDGFDYKVTTYEDGSTMKQLLTAPATLSLEQVKEEKKEELTQAYYMSFTAFQSDATGVLKTYPADAEAQQNLKDYEQRAIADPEKDSFWFKTLEDGTLIQHTRKQFLQLMEDAELFKVNQTIKQNNLINQVEAVVVGDLTEDEAKAQVEAITWE